MVSNVAALALIMSYRRKGPHRPRPLKNWRKTLAYTKHTLQCNRFDNTLYYYHMYIIPHPPDYKTHPFPLF